MIALLESLGTVRAAGVLTPKDPADARPKSLSGVYGRGAFPWHTDGAVASDPPRWLGMHSAAASVVTTEVLDPSPDLLHAFSRTTVRATDSSGQTVMRLALMNVTDDLTRVRWDPRACPSGDLELEAQVEAERATGHVTWAGDTWVVLDNFRLLHRRPSAVADPSRELRRYYAN